MMDPINQLKTFDIMPRVYEEDSFILSESSNWLLGTCLTALLLLIQLHQPIHFQDPFNQCKFARSRVLDRLSTY
jgi:hypothetical protein